MESHRAIERSRAIEDSREIKISLDVNDHGGMYEQYTCTIDDSRGGIQHVFIHVDYIEGHMMLAEYTDFNLDIVADLKGNINTLEQLAIRSWDGTILGRLHQNTVVSDVSNSPIMEFVLLPRKTTDKAIIGDPRTKDVLAYLHTGDPDDPTELTTIVYKAHQHVVTKTLILLLAFKTFKAKACPKLKIPPINYHGLDELANIQNITIFKSSFLKVHNIDYNYFDVMEATTNQNLLTFMVSTDGYNGYLLEVFNLNGQRLFTAAPLLKFSFLTKLYMNETIEIGQVESYRLRAKSLMTKYNAELKADGKQIWNDANRYFEIFRMLTKQKIATITPDSFASPRRVTVNIHPAVDTMHKALIFTFAMKLIYNFYRFYTDIVSQKKCLPQPSTDPMGPKNAAYAGESYQSDQAAYSGHASYGGHVSHSYQPTYPGQGISAGQSYHSYQATYPEHGACDGQTYQGYQPPNTGETDYQDHQSQRAYAGQKRCLPQTFTDTMGPKKAAYSGESYQGYQAMLPGQGTSVGQAYHGYQVTYPGQGAYDGRTYQGYQPPYTGERAYPGDQSQGAYGGQRVSGDIQFLFAAQQSHVGESTYAAPACGEQRREPTPPGTSSTSTQEVTVHPNLRILSGNDCTPPPPPNVMAKADPCNQDSD